MTAARAAHAALVAALSLAPVLAHASNTRGLEGYLALVERYRSDTREAQAPSPWTKAEFEQALEELVRHEEAGALGACPDDCLRSAVLLHTDGAQRLRTGALHADADWHVEAARRLLALHERRAGRAASAGLRQGFLMALGYHYLASARMLPAAEAFGRVTEEAPGNAAAWAAAGMAQEALGTIDVKGGGPIWESPELRQSLMDGPWNQSLLVAIALQERALKAALRDYEQALALDAGCVEARLRRARVLMQLKRGAQATPELERVLREAKEPRHVFVANMLAGAQAQSAGRTQAALQRFRAANQADPHSVTGLLALSHALHQAGQPAEAAATVRFALDLDTTGDPLEPWLQYQLGPPGAFEAAIAALRRQVSR